MREIIFIRITGQDKPGVTANLCGVLAEHQVDILDIGQAVTHDTLILGILISIPPTEQSAPIIKEVLFAAHEMNVDVSFQPVSRDSYAQWVESQGKQRHIVTLLSRNINAQQMARVTEIIARHGLNIDVMTRLSGRRPLEDFDIADDNTFTTPAEIAQNAPLRAACVEFSVRGTPDDQSKLRAEFLEVASQMDVDIAFQEDNAFRRNRRLVAFDMDSTLVKLEGIDELAALAGKGKEVSEITLSAMRGEIDFRESLTRRLKLCRGVREAELREIAQRIPLTDGADRLIFNLKRLGYKIAIISGGFTYFGKFLQERFGFDYLCANELEIVDGVVTGNLVGDIVDGPGKANFLRKIAEKENISLQQVIAVGDGANDLPMLNIAGLGIAFRAKPVVRSGAGQAISTFGLDSILYLLGVPDRDTII